MLKLPYRFIISTFLFVMLGVNAIVFAEPITEAPLTDDVVNVEQPFVDPEESEEQRQTDIDKLNEEMGLGEQKTIVVDDVKATPNDNTALTKKVVPDTKSELIKMVKMFLKVMLAVAASSVVIFIILLIVRRFYSPKVTLEDLNTVDENKATLDTPRDKNEALKTFLDKTKEM